MKKIDYIISAFLVVTIIASFFVAQYYINVKINARLEKLEAASTTAQQPFERHYSFRCGTMQKVPFEVSPSWKPVVRVDSLYRNVFIDFYSE